MRVELLTVFNGLVKIVRADVAITSLLRLWLLFTRTNGPESAHATHDDYVPVLEASTWKFVPLVLLPMAEVSVWNRTVGRQVRMGPYVHLGRSPTFENSAGLLVESFRT